MTTERSESIKELAGALAKAQAAIQPAKKESENPHFRSKYADLSSIWDACREPLAKNGLSVLQMPTDSEAGRVGLTCMLLHSSGEYISCTVSTKLRQEDAQSVGSALTYLRRYTLAAMVGIVADEDDDGNSASAPGRQQSTSAPTQANGNGHTGKASEKQVKMLFAIWKSSGYDGILQDWIKESYGCKVDDLTMRQASEAIEALQPKDQKATAQAKDESLL
jgi:ERF superfamily protein